jgi:NAD(P)H-dependent flavin oxidoreductase YrpB (nitropropane dioxygenase family)
MRRASGGGCGAPELASRGMRTSFTDLIGCRLPIQQAGFDSLNTELAAAVSKVGGLGMIGAPT